MQRTRTVRRIASSRVTDRLHIPIPVRWGDLDAFNHVNNAAMLTILEEARVRAFWRPGEDEEAPPTAVLESGIDHGVLALIARHEIEYMAPVPYQRRPLDVQMWFGKIGGSSLEVCYEVRTAPEVEPPVLYTRALTVIVLVDASSGRPIRLTPEMRSAWEPYVGDPLAFTRR